MTEKEVVKYINKLKYGWSKYGDPNFGLIQKDLTKDWTCQSCAQIQALHLPHFLFEFIDREFIHICSKCQNLVIRYSIIDFQVLIAKARKT